MLPLFTVLFLAGVSVAVKQIMPDHVLARQEKGGSALHKVKLEKG
jgi:hypothetical protein